MSSSFHSNSSNIVYNFVENNAENDRPNLDENVTFDINLINNVKEHPCIYNKKKLKSDKCVVQAWKQVSATMQASEEVCKSRWTRLREYFSKERKRRESNGSRSPWALYDFMQFMEPFVGRKKPFKRAKSMSALCPTSYDFGEPLRKKNTGYVSDSNIEITNEFINAKSLITCGYCEFICAEDKVTEHLCLKIFQEYFIDESFKFWGIDDTGEPVYELSEDQEYKIIETLNSSKENQLNNNRYEKVIEDKVFNAVERKLDEEKKLILEVQKREPLWNHMLPLNERSKIIKRKLWKEVSKVTKGSFTFQSARKKFKSLTDTYKAILHSEKSSSGSAQKSVGEKWAYYHSMEFLKDFITNPTTSNSDTSSESSYGIGNEEEYELNLLNDIVEDDSASKYSNKKCQNCFQFTVNNKMFEPFDKVANAIADSSRQIVVSLPPPMNEIDFCSNVIACRLKKIPEINQSKATQDMLSYSMEVLKKYTN